MAEILQLESVDYHYITQGEKSYFYPYSLSSDAIKDYDEEIKYIPCWSLAALLGVLPRVDIEKEICSDDTYDYRVKAYIGDGYIGDWYDNPVDACYVLILKLHELKML